MTLLCKWLGHRWEYDGWWKIDNGWRRHRTCRRCRLEETWTTNLKNKPLDIAEE